MIKESELPTLSSLLAFEASVRNQSMTDAAHELGITQPLVSQRIRSLEEIIGGILIDRSIKPLAPTQAGLKYYHELKEPLEAIRHATMKVKSDVQEPRTKISISVYFGFAFHWLMPRLQRLQEAFPDYLFEVLPTNSLKEVLASKADILFHFSTSTGQYQFEKLLIPEEVYPVCSPDFAKKYQLKSGDILESLHNLPLLHKDKGDERWFDWQNWSEKLGIKPPNHPVTFCYHNYPLMIEAAVKGHGVCLAWEGLINAFIDEGELIPLGPRIKSINRGYQICSNYYSTFAVGNVINWLIDEVETPNV
ncbi:LysR substrate-binding domain-containing protein [Marinomonas sp.]